MKSTDISDSMGKKLAFWSINLALLSVPLVFFPDANLIFEIPKVAVFRSLVLLAWLGIALSAAWGGRGTGEGSVAFFFERRIFWLVGVWIGVLALAVVFSISPWTSFFGSYFRQQGLVQMIFYLMFFGAIVHTMDRKERVEQALKWLCAGAFLAAVAAVGHYFGWGVYRAFGTMGHPNFLGTYLVMCLPFLALLFGRRWFWGVVGLVCGIAIFLTFSKAAVLGVLAAGLVWAFFSAKRGMSVVLASVGICGVVAAVGMFLAGGDSVPYESASDRLLMQGDSVKSLEVRLDIWREAVLLVVDRPLLGIGPEAFGRTHPEAEAIGYGGVPDRAHNEILDSLLSGGILGFFAYFGLLFYVFLVCYRRRADRVVVACAASLAGLLAANMFGFSTTVHYMVWWAVLGVVVVRTGERISFEVSTKKGFAARGFAARGFAALIVGAIAAFLIFNFGFRVLYADYLYSSGIEKVFEFDQEAASSYFKRARDWNPVEEYYRTGN